MASAAAQACYGNIARDPAEKRLQAVRALRRHGVPGREPRIVHALLRVLGIPQEIIRHRVAIPPIGILRFRDGALGALPIESDDARVVHASHLLTLLKSQKRSKRFHIF